MASLPAPPTATTSGLGSEVQQRAGRGFPSVASTAVSVSPVPVLHPERTGSVGTVPPGLPAGSGAQPGPAGGWEGPGFRKRGSRQDSHQGRPRSEVPVGRSPCCPSLLVLLPERGHRRGRAALCSQRDFHWGRGDLPGGRGSVHRAREQMQELAGEVGSLTLLTEGPAETSANPNPGGAGGTWLDGEGRRGGGAAASGYVKAGSAMPWSGLQVKAMVMA